MTVPASGGTGLVRHALDDASSSGTSVRIPLSYPLSEFGMTVTHTLSSAGVVVNLYGAAAATTGSTGATLLTKTSGQASGITVFTTGGVKQPVGLLVVELTQNQTTAGGASTGTVDVWITGVP